LPSRARGRWSAREHRRGLWLLIPALLALTIGGLALGGVIEIGAPAKPGVSAVQAGYGPLTPGTSHLLAITAPDPHGGPAWGMRVFATKRGVGCMQVGRLLDDRLGALGRDGAFNDDGHFHEVPAGGAIRFSACSALDGKGRIFNNTILSNQPASAWSGFGSCVPSSATPAEKAPELGDPAKPRGLAPERPHPVRICPQADERNLYYGLLGPEAASITYTSGARHRTVPTVGAEGAYLIVTQAPSHQLYSGAAGGTSNVVPVHGPITAIHYRDGRTCHLTSRSWIGGTSACTPSLRVPVGYLPVKAPTAAQVSTPIHARAVRNRRGEREIVVSFVSRVPITEYRSEYSLKLDESELHGRASAPYRADAGANVAAGQTVSARIKRHGPHGGSVPAGVYRGTLTLIAATGPALYEGPGTAYLHVGDFSVRVP
jgi:hypothetical protein